MDITAFAGINRNSAHPDEAFTVLDFQIRREVQKGFPIYSAMHSLPTHMDLYSNEYPAHGQAMSEEHFESFSRLRDQIIWTITTTAMRKMSCGNPRRARRRNRRKVRKNRNDPLHRQPL